MYRIWWGGKYTSVSDFEAFVVHGIGTENKEELENVLLCSQNTRTYSLPLLI